MLIRVAHSPDADDAFMFYALAKNAIDTRGFVFEHILKDIESLNQDAFSGTYEVTAISYHAYPYLADRYRLMTCGGSIGTQYGPIVVSRRPLESLEGVTIGVPGRLTTARLALKLYENNYDEMLMNFDDILPAVARGDLEAGLIIHEGQISYEAEGLVKVVDLGEWWYEKTGLPLPLGGNVIRRDVPEPEIVAGLIRKSILYALEHEDEALNYALSFGRGLDREDARRFVRMYVNEETVEISPEARQAVELLLREGYENGIIDRPVEIDWVEPASL
jgi:1,4-dihydroxy-6-naphthoate synthase